jgi:serine/threonine protein kinase/uncharacterized membrane protein
VETVGAYRLLRQIGEGGMGVVHLALAPDNSRVAVKILRPQVIGGQQARQRLEREVAAMRRVRSPRVAECVDADPWGDPPYVVTRYVAGLSLTEYVAEYGALDPARLHRFAAGTAHALAGVHAAGVLHRDIKPSNVLLDRDEPVLIDFGLAMTGDEARMTHAGWVFGTPAYLAPEVVLGDPPTLAVDIHGWAATVAFAATGRSPYGEGPSVVVLDRIRRGDFSLDGVARPLVDVLRRCLSQEPHQRPTAWELCRWIDRLDGASAGSTRPSPVHTSALHTSVLHSPSGRSPSGHASSGHSPSAQAGSTGTHGHQRAGQAVQPGPAAWRPAPAGPQVRTTATPPGALHAPVTTSTHPAVPTAVGAWAARPSDVSSGTRALQWMAGAGGAGAIAGAFALAPFLTTLAVALVLVAVHAGFATGDRRRRMEQRRGPRSRDGLVSVLAWPLRAVAALPVVVVSCALSLMAATMLSALEAGLGPGEGSAATVAGGAAFTALLWLGPAASTLRRAGGAVTRTVLTSPTAGAVTVVLLAAAAVVLLLMAQASVTSWLPLGDAPWRDLPGGL